MQVFQVVPPIMRDVGNGLEMDRDFFNSLSIYMEHFEGFAIACPVRREGAEKTGLGQCVPLAELPWGPERFKFIELPLAYRPAEFAKALPSVRRLLRVEIEVATHLIFTPYSVVGDWPTVAIKEAVKLKRPYTIEADGVHGDVMRKRHISNTAWKRWTKLNIEFPAFDRSYRRNLARSSLGIFQGADVFNAYARDCPKPMKLNHHIPIYRGDHITAKELKAKVASIRKGGPLKIVYAGRAIDMKGPFDWIDTLAELSKLGVKFEATWLGEGPMLDQMKDRAKGVTFTGAVDKASVQKAIKEAHVFLFCHNTLESARILGEALAYGAPLVGFRTDYPADLVAEHGGGSFVPMGDVKALAGKLAELDRDRNALADMVESAAKSGSVFDREKALLARVEAVKRNRYYPPEPIYYLPQGDCASA